MPTKKPREEKQANQEEDIEDKSRISLTKEKQVSHAKTKGVGKVR